MILCPSCKTLNPEGESKCLSCQSALGEGDGGARPTVVESEGGDATARCAHGHPVDPAWDRCPYCERGVGAGAASVPTRLEDTAVGGDRGAGDIRAGRATRLEATRPEGSAGARRQTRLAQEGPPGGGANGEAAQPPTPRRPQPGAGSGRGARTTRLEQATDASASGPSGRHTVLGSAAAGVAAPGPDPAASGTPLRPAGATAPAPAQAPSTRRLTAVLAAPGLRPGGAVFAVREGKNRIGAGGDNEIRLDDDPQVSSEHALLLCRGDVFHLADRMSSNGTAVNGEDLEGTHSTVLEDRDRIRCGATELQFLRVTPEGGATTGNEEAEDGDPSPVESP